MIVIKQEDLDRIYQHAEKSYPYECCGILVGKRDGRREVMRVYCTTNVNRERAQDRYEIDPEELYHIDRECQQNGLEIIGFYHSHPGHPPYPSAIDGTKAWPEYSYLIISVMEKSKMRLKSWVWNEVTDEFTEEEIFITQGEKNS